MSNYNHLLEAIHLNIGQLSNPNIVNGAHGYCMEKNDNSLELYMLCKKEDIKKKDPDFKHFDTKCIYCRKELDK
tara:strand:- start:19 stop:240 length:222 start_codon:yes stop_codon:yes gene_type:complete